MGRLIDYAKGIKRNVDKRKLYSRMKKYNGDAIEKVLEYCQTAEELRTPYNCSRHYGGQYSIQMCNDIIQYLFYECKMGAYCKGGAGVEPQSFMREYILNRLPEIDAESKIMEVGPGNLPIFDEAEYSKWYSCDINYSNNSILFGDKEWAKDKYKNIFSGGWETLSRVCEENHLGKDFDLVCGSHSYEHCHKPIHALRETAAILHTGGYFVVFVPDGYSTWEGNYDRTHTMYMGLDMVKDFFECVGEMKLLECEQFRTNMDIVIIAQKI